MKSNNKVVEQVHKTRPELIMLIELDLSYISESASPLINEKRTRGGWKLLLNWNDPGTGFVYNIVGLVASP